MTTKHLIAPAAMALAIIWAAGPALAQSGGNDRQQRSRDRSTYSANSGSQNRDSRGSQARASRGSGQSRGEAVRRAVPRGDVSRGGSAVDRGRASGGYDARQYGSNNRSSGNRGYATGGYSAGRYDSGRYSNRGSGYGYSNRGYGYGGYGRDSWRSRIRFGLGISIFAGNPFGFRFDYGWRPRFAYHYSMRPGLAYGGMSFLLDPDYAEVYIDGQFVGVARDFGGQPVPVAVGYHRIELFAQGFEPVGFDIQVFPGQVIPYRGSLNQDQVGY